MISKLKAFIVGASLVAGCIASGASAATVTFNFTNSTSANWMSSLNYTAGSLGLTVTGGDTTGGSGKVATWTGHGLGMKSGTDCTWGCSGTDHQIDSSGLDDVVTLTFTKAVSMANIVFNYVDPSDRFDLYEGSTKTVSNGVVKNLVNLTTGTNSVFRIGAGVQNNTTCSRWFGCYTTQTNSAFKLASITVSYSDNPATVPVPAAGLLLMGGLGALGIARRRGKTA